MVLSAVETTTVSRAAIIDATPVSATTHARCLLVILACGSMNLLRRVPCHGDPPSRRNPSRLASISSATWRQGEGLELGAHERGDLRDATVGVEPEQLKDFQVLRLAGIPEEHDA